MLVWKLNETSIALTELKNIYQLEIGSITGLEVYTKIMHAVRYLDLIEETCPHSIMLDSVRDIAKRARYITRDCADIDYVAEEKKGSEDDIVPSIPYVPIEVPEEDLDEALQSEDF